MLDTSKLPDEDARGFSIALEPSGDCVTLTLRRGMEHSRTAERWAESVCRACGTAIVRARVDLSQQSLLASTLIAGLVHLSDEFTKRGGGLELVAVNDRIMRTLMMMRLSGLFSFSEE